MALPELRMSFADRTGLEREVQSNLMHGRAFVAGATGLQVLEDCVLVLERPGDGRELSLSAQAVLIGAHPPMIGIGVQLKPFNAAVIAALTEFIAGQPEARAGATAPRPSAAPDGDGSDAQSETEHAGARPASDSTAPPATDEGEQPLALDTDEGADLGSLDADGLGARMPDGQPLPSDVQKLPARHERMRNLAVTEQLKIARNGDFNDRVMLERIYSKAVWEGLLHNPKLTLPEVAGIARKGSLPRPLLELIVDNNAWIQSALVRRALLGNPRVSSEAILKLLRMTPKHELKVIHKTTTYSNQVREIARKVLEM